jgi:tetratricopeptide (TPR) repeat protein
MAKLCYSAILCLVLSLGCGLLVAQTEERREQGTPPRSDAAAADPNDSSSRQTKVDLSAPPGETPLDLKGKPAGDRIEVKPWDPHKAEHNVEVGDQYFHKKNFSAAISRYREALYWKDNDAMASFRLACALEQVGQFAESRKYYQQYLNILPKGPYAAEARKSLDRLKDKSDDASKAQPLPAHVPAMP